MTKKVRAFHAAQYLARLRQLGFEFVLLGIVGEPDSLKIHYRFPPEQWEWVEKVIEPEVIAHKPALIARLMEEGRQRQAVLLAAVTHAPPPLRLVA